MGRIYKDILIGKKKHNALFDSGSLVSYILSDAMPESCDCSILPKPITSRLAGKTHILKKRCLVPVSIDGEKILLDTFVIEGKIGHPIDSKREIDVLFGATGMETWGIKLNPKRQDIDLSETRKREFLSF